MAGGFVPPRTPETEEFWNGTQRGELRIQRCDDCARHYFFPRPFCPRCGSTSVEWTTVSGRGRLLSYVINERPVPPADADPQVVALVELAEGPRMMTNIVGVPPDPAHLPLDAPVHVDFEVRGPEMLPVFRLGAQGESARSEAAEAGR
jgi:uncharacterized OB-fold protein